MADVDYKAEPVVPDMRANIACDRNSFGILFPRIYSKKKEVKKKKERSTAPTDLPVNFASRKGALSLYLNINNFKSEEASRK